MRKRVNPVSAKRRDELTIYAKKRKAFLAKHPRCAVYPRRKATDIHHMRGRAGRLFLSEDYWLPVCREAHVKIGNEPKWARDNGYLCAKGEWGKQPEER